MLVEQLDFFRWLVGLSVDNRVWDTTVLTKNRDRLLRCRIAVLFVERVLAQASEWGFKPVST